MALQAKILLFSEDVTDLLHAIRHDATTAESPYPFVQIPPQISLPYECVVYHRLSDARIPACRDFLAPYFQHESLEHQNKNLALAIVLKATSGRIFAVTFGASGDRCLNLDKIEPRFGLETALSLSDGGFTTVDTRRLDIASQQNVTRLSRDERRLGAFDVHGSKLITRIRGKSTGGLVSAASGSDSFHGSVNCSLETLADFCDRLLHAFVTKSYALDEEMRLLLEKLSPLPRKHSHVGSLNASLRSLLYSGDCEKIEFDWPDAIRDEDRVVRFRLWHRRSRLYVDVSSPDLGAISRFYRGLSQAIEGAPALDKIHVAGEDGDGNVVTGSNSLSKCLAAEVEKSGDVYVHIAGQWYRVGRDYVQRLRRQVDALVDLTASISLPAMSGDEDKYNLAIANSRGYVLMDKKYHYVSHDKFEHSDLIDVANRRFICVKKGQSSQDLVYLFHQAALSARMARISPEFRDRMYRFIGDERQRASALLESGTYVLAIATTKVGPFSRTLFLPSLIVLNDYVEQITSCNYSIALCRIQLCGADQAVVE